MKKISVLIIETSLFYRDAFRRCLDELPDIEIAGVTPTARLALEKIGQDLPDVILLDQGVTDVALPELVRQILAAHPQLGIIVTAPENDQAAAARTIEALAAGAFDCVLKPASVPEKEPCDILQRRILPKVRSFSIQRYSRSALTAGESVAHIVPSVCSASSIERLKAVAGGAAGRPLRYEVVLIGASTGGPDALLQLLPQFPADFCLPIAIVLHMPKEFTKAMAAALDRAAAIQVTEASEGQELLAGHAYLAPGGEHLEIVRETRGRLAAHISSAPPENGCRPAVDVLFRSAAAVVKQHAIAAVLTGMGSDGLKGATLLKQQGACILAQDERSSLVWGMPGSLQRAGVAETVLPLGAIAPEILARIASR